MKPSRRRRSSEPLIHIGATPATIASARQAILDICKAPTAPDVKIAALSALTMLCKVEHTTITNCTFTGL